MSTFPTSIEELTGEWLSQAIGTTVESFEAAPLGVGVGVLGLVTRVTLVSTSGPKTVIVKFPSSAPENRAVADSYDMYGKEYRFYTQIAPTVPLRAPKCYHAEFNSDNNDFVLVLEELEGFRIGDQVEGCSKAEAHELIAGIASLHRSTWQPDHITDIKPHDMPYQRLGMIDGIKMGLPVVLKEFPELFDDELTQVCTDLPNHVASLLDRIAPGPMVIVHGDVRLDNIFFADDGIAMVDFQALCKAPPEHDLAYFVTQSLPADVRRSEDWLAHYHAALTSEGISYSIEDSRLRYRLYVMYFLCYAIIIAGTLDAANERGRKLGEILLGNALESIRELDAIELIR